MSERVIDVVPGLVRGQKADGRCRYDAQAKAELVRRCGQPGVSVAAMALAHGVNANLLRRWICLSERSGTRRSALLLSCSKVSVKSPLSQAIQYTLTRWAALTRYVTDGALEIDNNAAERAIRALVLGRRNYLFAGSDAGGETAARLYSLIGTCRLNGIDPHAYLRHVLACVADHPVNRIQELLPWNVALENPAVACVFHAKPGHCFT